MSQSTSKNRNASSSSSSSVPSPTQAFDDYLTHMTAAMEGLTTHAAKLPPKSDLSFHRTLDRGFARDLDAASEKVLAMTERLLSLVHVNEEGSKGKTKVKTPVKSKSARRRKMEDEDDVVDGYRSVVGVVDGLLEDADSCLDELNGQKKKAAITVKPSLVAAAGQKLPGPFAQLRERLPLSIFQNNNLAKPQLLFHDVPNPSSSSIWKPQLATKPHAMVPLDFVPPLEYTLTEEEELDPSKEHWRREKEVRLRQHPYFYETRHLPYPTSMFIESPPTPPPTFDEQPFEFVDTPEKLDEMVQKLLKAKEIAVDLEHHSMRSYAGFTCLIQISTRKGDWVVDALKLRKELREGKLGDVMTDPGIIKVFHGADSDIVWLQHDFDIYVVNLFDTYHATVVLRMEQHSLARLLQLYCNFEADKRYQKADWRTRPLPQGMLEYARSDTHFLLFIYDNLRNALLEQSSRPPSPDAEGNTVIETTRRNPQAAMREVLNRSADTALKLYDQPTYDAETGRGSGGWLAPGKKWLPKGAIDEEPGFVWRKIHAWRDRVARELDESPFYIMPNDILLALSRLQGTAPILIRQALEGDRAPIARQRSAEITKLIKEAKAEYVASVVAKAKVAEPAQAVSSSSTKAFEVHTTPKPVKKAISPPQAATVPPDVWDAITVPAPSSLPFASADVRAKVKSSLFGTTIKSQKKPSGSDSSASETAGSSAKHTSALFGDALKGKGRTTKKKAVRGLPPGFADVQNGIHQQLAPKKTALPVEAEAEAQVTSSANVLEPETVPFIPVGQRRTGAAPALASTVGTSKSTAAQDSTSGPIAPSPATRLTEEKKVKAEDGAEAEDGVVQVKKKKKQKKRERVGSTSTSLEEASKKVKLASEAEAEADAQGASTSAIGEKEKEKKKVKKVKVKKDKIKIEDIPTFDYATETNLLDQPQAASSQSSAAKGKKEKKRRGPKEQRGIGAVEIPTFGARAARDLSQPKGGNKSGTFV